MSEAANVSQTHTIRWVVSTTKPGRYWGVRFSLEPGCLIHVGVNWRAPAARIVVLCLGVWFGRIPYEEQVEGSAIEIPDKLRGAPSDMKDD